MRAAAQIAVKDIKLRVRDRSVLIIGIIAPLALAFIFSIVFGSAVGSGHLGLEYGMVDLDRTEVSRALTEVLEGAEAEGVLILEEFGSSDEAQAAIEDGVIDAFFLIPADLGDAIVFNRRATIEVVADVDAPVSAEIAASFARQYSSGLAAGRLAVATTAALWEAELTPGFFASLDRSPAEASFNFTISDLAAASRQLDASTYFAAGMAVFFLFFTVQFGVAGLLEEERQGTMARLKAAPISRLSVIGGKAILALALGVVSMGVLVVATTFLPGLEASWGAPLGVAVLIVAGVLSAIGIMGLVAAVAKTPEGAGNLGSIIAVILAMLGGSFFPIASSGGVLASLTFLTPHAWFLRGLGDLADMGPWTAALQPAGAMVAFAVVTGSVAFVLLKRRLAR